MNRHERRSIASQNGGWGPWEKGVWPDPDPAKMEAIARSTGYPLEAVVAMMNESRQHETLWINNVYQVNIRIGPNMVHLSIKRRDRRPVGIERFRDFQRIKNDLVGPENEAVELYPAESRLADSANQYHLWVSRDPNFRFPFGFNDRLVLDADTAQGTGAVQQKF